MGSVTSAALKSFGFKDARVLAAALILGFFLLSGGSSRPELPVHSLLRFVAVMALCVALSFASWSDMKARSGPALLVIAGAVAIMLLQLLPLPPSLWRSLPGQGAVIEIMDAAGQGGQWRPMTLSASATWNAMLSLLIPAATLFLLSVQDSRKLARLIGFIVLIALAGAAFGFLQLALGGQKTLYLFEISNFGSATGFFANRNHHAAFLVCVMPLAMYLAIRASRTGNDERLSLFWIGAGLFLAIGATTTGSRQGLLLAVLMIAGLAWLGARRADLIQTLTASLPSARGRSFGRLEFVAVVVVLLATMGAGYWLSASGSDSGLDRLLSSDRDEELRWLAIPIYTQIVADFFPFGTGMGTFEHVFRQYEPRDMLSPSYMNEAHNDWLQLLMEGGVPVALFVCLVGWRSVAAFAGRTRSLNRQEGVESDLKPCALFGIVALLLFSAVDYPARTPAMMALAAILAFCAINKGSTGSRDAVVTEMA